MTSKEFNQYILTLNVDEFTVFYKTHSNKVVKDFYKISSRDLEKILNQFNILHKTQQETNKLISSTLKNKSEEEKNSITAKRLSTRDRWSDEYRQSVSNKQSTIRKNFTAEQKQHQLESFRNTLSCRTVECQKEINSKISVAVKNRFNSMPEEERKAFSEKMKAVYANLPEDIKEQRKLHISESFRKSCQSKYGVDNVLQLSAVRDKIKQTLLKKYGVDVACQLPQCRLKGNDSSINGDFKTLLIKNNLYVNDELNREFNIGRFSYDFKIGNNLIELNPTVTHNSTWSPYNNQAKDKQYHYNKCKLARDNNYRCICVWDWDNTNKILGLLLNRKRVYARKCTIREVDLSVAREYLNQYHLQGYVKSQINLGLYYNDILISLMTFGKPRYNKNYEYELLRYCSSYFIVGGAEKLFSYFVRNYNPSSIISYCDWSKFKGDIYIRLGFKFNNYSIGKHWYNIKTNQHITDNLLRQRGFDQLFGTNYGKGISNEKLMLEHGFVAVYDAGQATYTWRNIIT